MTLQHDMEAYLSELRDGTQSLKHVHSDLQSRISTALDNLPDSGHAEVVRELQLEFASVKEQNLALHEKIHAIEDDIKDVTASSEPLQKMAEATRSSDTSDANAKLLTLQHSLECYVSELREQTNSFHSIRTDLNTKIRETLDNLQLLDQSKVVGGLQLEVCSVQDQHTSLCQRVDVIQQELKSLVLVSHTATTDVSPVDAEIKGHVELETESHTEHDGFAEGLAQVGYVEDDVGVVARLATVERDLQDLTDVHNMGAQFQEQLHSETANLQSKIEELEQVVNSKNQSDDLLEQSVKLQAQIDSLKRTMQEKMAVAPTDQLDDVSAKLLHVERGLQDLLEAAPCPEHRADVGGKLRNVERGLQDLRQAQTLVEAQDIEFAEFYASVVKFQAEVLTTMQDPQVQRGLLQPSRAPQQPEEETLRKNDMAVFQQQPLDLEQLACEVRRATASAAHRATLDEYRAEALDALNSRVSAVSERLADTCDRLVTVENGLESSGRGNIVHQKQLERLHGTIRIRVDELAEDLSQVAMRQWRWRKAFLLSWRMIRRALHQLVKQQLV